MREAGGKHRDAIVKLVELHIKATELLKYNPEKAAPHVKNFVAKGLLEEAVVLKALKSPSSNFRADPTSILKQTEYMANFQKSKKIKTKVSTDGLFDASVYKEARANLGK